MNGHGDAFAITVERPADRTDEQWETAKAEIAAACAPLISDLLGRCVERTWCTGAGHDEHAEFHSSETIDLLPAVDGAEVAPVSAWLVENRDDDRGVRLVIDGSGHFAGRQASCELDARDAALLLTATVEGASRDAERDARCQLLNVLASVDGLANGIHGWNARSAR